MQKVRQTILSMTFMLFFLANISAVLADEVNYEKIYKKQCATCHGSKGNGKGRAGASFATLPTDFTSAKSRRTLSAERIKAGIRDGVLGTPMVAYGRRFNDETLNGLTDFIQVSFMSRLSREASQATKKEERNTNTHGQKIYNDNCSACHGDKGQSAVWAQNGLNPPPRNFTTAQARDELSQERMIASVTYGRPGTAMMSFSTRLSTADIEAVVRYIHDSFMQPNVKTEISVSSLGHRLPNRSADASVNGFAVEQKPPHEIKVDMLAAFPKKIIGNALSGKIFYDASCFNCHGLKGDGEGPRADFNYPRPRDFTSKESRLIFNRPRLFQSVSRGKRGTVMPAWKTVLTGQQIADVAEYVFQQFILSNETGATLNTALKKKLQQ